MSLRESASLLRQPYSPLGGPLHRPTSSNGGGAFSPRGVAAPSVHPGERERPPPVSSFLYTRYRAILLLVGLVLFGYVALLLRWCQQGCLAAQKASDYITQEQFNRPLQPCPKQQCAECPACPSAAAATSAAAGTIGVSSPNEAESEASRLAEVSRVVSMQDVLPFASSPGDSTGSMLILHSDSGDTDAFTYELCSFTRACVAPDAIYLFVQKREEYDALSSMFEQCVGPKDKRYKAPDGHYSPCHCFYPQMAPKLLPFWTDNPDAGTSSADDSTPNYSAPSFQWQTRHDPLADLREGHSILLHKFVRIHHIAHWAQKVVFLQSMMQHARLFPQGNEGDAVQITSYLPATHARSHRAWTGGSLATPWVGMAMADMDLPLTPHEAFIFNASLSAILQANPEQHVLQQWLQQGQEGSQGMEGPEPGAFTFAGEFEDLWRRYRAHVTGESAALLEMQQASGKKNSAALKAAQAKLAEIPSPPTPMRCYERLSWNRNFGVVSSASSDTAAFRAASYAALGMEKTLARRCPPRKIILLYRSNRGILNWREVADLVTEVTGWVPERATINGDSTPEEQVRLFASAGLLISSHSSQLINVLFSHPSSAMIEASSEFFNADFAEYAHGMGVFFRYALGGEVEGAVQPVDPGIQGCIDELSHCEGNSHCILVHRAHCPPRHALNKNKNFRANLTAVRQALVAAKNHLNWACDGLWSKYEY